VASSPTAQEAEPPRPTFPGIAWERKKRFYVLDSYTINLRDFLSECLFD